MKNSNAHISNTKWRASLGAVLAFALLFFTSSFASSASQVQAQAMPASHSALMSADAHNHINGGDTMQMKDNHDCCADEDKPCTDNDCDMPCMSFSAAHAILASANTALYAQNADINASHSNVEGGISARLNAPPPRT